MTISVGKNVRSSCRIMVGEAIREQSDRTQNPNNLVCPVWNGLDTAARHVCENSFRTKQAGCNSALDRVLVENDVSRPHYMQYVTLSAEGIRGGQQCEGFNIVNPSTVCHDKAIKDAQSITGGFSQNLSRNLQCGACHSH